MPIDYKKINANKKFCNEEILEETAEELRVDKKFVEECVSSNSRFFKSVIETGAFESLTIPYLGKLKAKLHSIQKAMQNIKREKVV